jgi:thiamine biosynthesis lipoprotein
MKIDSGGSGKGLAADLLARKWTVDLMSDGRVPNFMIDCGGDIRFGGRNPHGYVNVTDPFDHRAIALPVNSGAVATSSIAGRIWETSDGHAHHLIDPATGEPAWTGVVQTTALAPSALIAETLSKVALLRGPEGAREVLAGFGGLFITDDGEVEYVPQAEEAIAA